MTVEDFSAFAREHWPNIRQTLRDETYQPAPVRRTESPEGGIFKREPFTVNVDPRLLYRDELLAINVIAMLIAFTALVTMLNAGISWIGGFVGHPGMTMQSLLGRGMSPLAWLAGVEWGDCRKVGALLGVKTALNEFVAYLQMSDAMRANPAFLSPRDALIATYALCGFANFASVGIQIGGISTMAPTRRHDLSRIGLLAMAGGAIASLMGACVVGVLI